MREGKKTMTTQQPCLQKRVSAAGSVRQVPINAAEVV